MVSDIETLLMKNIFLFLSAFFLTFGLNAQSPPFQWAKQLGGTGDSYSRGIAIDGSENVYTTGHFTGTMDFDPGPGTYNLTALGVRDIFVSKLDQNGNFIWAKQMGGSSNAGLSDYTFDIDVDMAGNVFVIGCFTDTADFDPNPGSAYEIFSNGNSDVFISQLDTNGDYISVEQYGGAGPDMGLSIAVDPSGFYIYACGNYNGTVNFGPGHIHTAVGMDDIFVLKVTSTSTLHWARSYGGPGTDNGTEIALDSTGYVYLGSLFSSTANFQGTNLTASGTWWDVAVAKINPIGGLVFVKQMGGPDPDQPLGIAADNAGNVFTVGAFQSTADFDPSASVFNMTSAGNVDIFVTKLNPSGSFAWAKQMGGIDYDHVLGVALDAASNVYTTGHFYDVVDFDPGVTTNNISSAGSDDMFISKLDSSGNFSWVRTMGSSADDISHSIVVSNAGNIYTTGYWGNGSTTDFDPDSSTFDMTSFGQRDVYVHKMGLGSTVTVKENNFENNFSVYPNPAKDLVNIAFDNIEKEPELSIIDISGKLIFRSTYQNIQEISLDLKPIEAGIYFIRIKTSQFTEIRKFIKTK